MQTYIYGRHCSGTGRHGTRLQWQTDTVLQCTVDIPDGLFRHTVPTERMTDIPTDRHGTMRYGSHCSGRRGSHWQARRPLALALPWHCSSRPCAGDGADWRDTAQTLGCSLELLPVNAGEATAGVKAPRRLSIAASERDILTAFGGLKDIDGMI